MTRRELMHRIGSDELKEWLAFERIHPFEDGYWQAAQVSFTVARSQGAKGIRFDDFLPRKAVPACAGKIAVAPGLIDHIRLAKAAAKDR